MKIATECICCQSTKLTRTPTVLMPFVAYRIFGWLPVKVQGYRDLQSGISYPVCNTLTCEHCATRFLDMRFNDDELKKLYLDYMSDSYISDRKIFEPNFDEKMAIEPRTYRQKVDEFIVDYLPFYRPLSILDYGSSNQKNTPFAEDNRVELYDIGGQEPTGTNYDLISCIHVLEHVSYPAEVLAAIKRYMNEKTLLYIELPIERNKAHWHEHINQFSLFSLPELLSRADLKILKYQILDEQPTKNIFGVYQLLCRLG